MATLFSAVCKDGTLLRSRVLERRLRLCKRRACLVDSVLRALHGGLLLDLIAVRRLLSRQHAIERLVDLAARRLESLLVLRLRGCQRRLRCLEVVVSCRYLLLSGKQALLVLGRVGL